MGREPHQLFGTTQKAYLRQEGATPEESLAVVKALKSQKAAQLRVIADLRHTLESATLKKGISELQRKAEIEKVRTDGLHQLQQLKTEQRAEIERLRRETAQQAAEVERVRETGQQKLDNATREYEYKRRELLADTARAVGEEKARGLRETEARTRELEAKVHQLQMNITVGDADANAQLQRAKSQVTAMQRKLETDIDRAVAHASAESKQELTEMQFEMEAAKNEALRLTAESAKYQERATRAQRAEAEAHTLYNETSEALAITNVKLHQALLAKQKGDTSKDAQIKALQTESFNLKQAADKTKEEMYRQRGQSSAQLVEVQTLLKQSQNAERMTKNWHELYDAEVAKGERANQEVMRNAKVALDASEQANKQLTADITRLTTDLAKSRSDADVADVGYQAQILALTEAQRAWTENQSRLDAATRMGETARRKGFEDKVSGLTARLSKAAAALGVAQQGTIHLEGKLRFLEGKAEGGQTVKARLEADLAEKNRKLAEQTQALAALQRDYQEATRKSASLSSQVEAQGKKVDEGLLKRAVQAEAAASSTKRELQNMSDQLGIARGETQRLRGELTFTQARVAAVPSQIAAQIAALEAEKAMLVSQLRQVRTGAADMSDQQQLKARQEIRAIEDKVDQATEAARKSGVAEGRQTQEREGRTESQRLQREAADRFAAMEAELGAKVQAHAASIADVKAQLADATRKVEEAGRERGRKREESKLEAQRMLEKSDAELKRVKEEAHAESARLIQKYDDMEKRLTQEGKDNAERMTKENDQKVAQEKATAEQTGVSSEEKVAALEKQHALDMERLNKELADKQAEAAKERDRIVAERENMLAALKSEHSKVEERLQGLAREEKEKARGVAEQMTKTFEGQLAEKEKGWATRLEAQEKLRAGEQQKMTEEREKFLAESKKWAQERFDVKLTTQNVDAMEASLQAQLKTLNDGHNRKIGDLKKIHTQAKDHAVKAAVSGLVSSHELELKRLRDKMAVMEKHLEAKEKNLTAAQGSLKTAEDANARYEKSNAEHRSRTMATQARHDKEKARLREDAQKLKADLLDARKEQSIPHGEFLPMLAHVNNRLETIDTDRAKSQTEHAETVAKLDAAQSERREKSHTKIEKARADVTKHAAELQTEMNEMHNVLGKAHDVALNAHNKAASDIQALLDQAGDHAANPTKASLAALPPALYKAGHESLEASPAALSLPAILKGSEPPATPVYTKPSVTELKTVPGHEVEVDLAPFEEDQGPGKLRKITEEKEQEMATEEGPVTATAQTMEPLGKTEVFKATQAANEGVALAEADGANRDATMEYMSQAEKQEYLSWQVTLSNFAKHDAEIARKNAKQMATWTTATETKQDVDSNIARDWARHEKNTEILMKQVDKNHVVVTDKRDAQGNPDWGITAEEVTKQKAATARWQQIYKDKLKTTVAAVFPADKPMLKLLGDQLAAEQVEIVRDAEKRDRRNTPTMPIDEQGPETKAAIAKVTGPGFRAALEYTSLPWWNASSTMASSDLLKRLREGGSAGATILKMVARQNETIHIKRPKVLKGPLKKHSLAQRSITGHTIKDFDTLTLPDLKKIQEEYLAITDQPTRFEEITDNFTQAKAAQGRISQLIHLKSQGIESRTSAFVTVSDPKPVERKRVRGRGLSKKPRKTAKPRKKRASSKKKTAKKAATPKKVPKTGLQKWESQKKSSRRQRKMVL